MRRSRAYLGVVIKPREVIAAVSILVLLLLLVAAWVGYQSTSQEAAGQAKAEKGTTDLPKEAEITIPEITVPELAIPEPMPKLEEDISADRPLRRIPGVSDMQIIGHLQYLPGSNFRCLGASPDRGLLRRVCRSSSGDNPPVVYEVTVVEKNPGTVLSVEATAYNASDEAATEFWATWQSSP